MSCPGYIGNAQWGGNVVCVDEVKVDDDMLLEYCDDCRADLLADMQVLYSIQREYVLSTRNYLTFDYDMV